QRLLAIRRSQRRRQRRRVSVDRRRAAAVALATARARTPQNETPCCTTIGCGGELAARAAVPVFPRRRAKLNRCAQPERWFPTLCFNRGTGASRIPRGGLNDRALCPWVCDRFE